MKHHYTCVLCLAVLCLASSCEVIHKPGTGTYAAVGVDYQSRKLDLVAGTMDSGPTNMSKSTEHTMRTVNSLGIGWLMADLAKAQDASKAATDQAGIKAGTDQAKIAADVDKAKLTQEVDLKALELEVPAPAPVP